MTEEEFVAQMKFPPGVELSLFSFMPEKTIDAVPALEPVYQAAAVVCGIIADNKRLALKAVEDVLKIVEGKEVYVRVPPESEDFVDFVTGKVVSKGYVRFSFFDRPGETINATTMSRYIHYVSLARSAEAVQ